MWTPIIKKCPNCGEEMFYDRIYNCFESSCGKTYNYSLQELAPKSQWKDEYDSEDEDY
jgi:uncharacterized OB-fold protein